jgi:hypothetical protein
VFIGGAGGDLIVVHARVGQRIVTLARDLVGIKLVRVSPDGQMVATVGIDDAIRFWTIGEELRR